LGVYELGQISGKHWGKHLVIWYFHWGKHLDFMVPMFANIYENRMIWGYIDAEASGWRWKDKLGVWGHHGDKYGLKGVEARKSWLVGLYRHLAMTQWHDIFLRHFF
jgi:hypothetical protein